MRHASLRNHLVLKIYSFCTPEIGIHKPLILLIVACGILRGFFHTNQLTVVFDRYRRPRRQLLGRHTLDLATTIRPDDVALENGRESTPGNGSIR
jgi:hypothetical protein